VDLYHIWCDLERGVSDLAFCEEVKRYLGALRDAGRIEAFRISRCKLGLGLQELGEFHIMIEIADLAQLDSAFRDVSARSGRIDLLHGAVQRSVRNVRFALYRDFPDVWRQSAGETT